LTKYFLLVVT